MNFTSLDEFARGAREGRISFDEFWKYSLPRWQKEATRLMTSVPGWVEQDDVLQEMASSAWKFLFKWNEQKAQRVNTPPVSVWGYVRWNALCEATKFVARARGVEMHRMKGASRYEIGMDQSFWDTYEETNGESAELYDDWRPIVSEWIADGCWSEGEKLALAAIGSTRGDLLHAAETLYANPKLRLFCKIGSRHRAKKVVRKVARSITSSLQGGV